MAPIETRVPVLDGTLTLALQIWYPAKVPFGSLQSLQHPKRALAYPGWLDNAGSFANIAPILCDKLDIIIAVIEYVTANPLDIGNTKKKLTC
jgi:hypothetical protein